MLFQILSYPWKTLYNELENRNGDLLNPCDRIFTMRTILFHYDLVESDLINSMGIRQSRNSQLTTKSRGFQTVSYDLKVNRNKMFDGSR